MDQYARGLALAALNPPPVTLPSTIINASVTSIILAEAKQRRGPTVITNNGYGDLLIRLGSIAALDSFHMCIEPGFTATITQQYGGNISGIWSAAGGSANVLEYI